MGMILSTMLDGYDHLKGPIQTCQRFIEIYNNTQLYICPSLIQRPSRTCERIHCEDFHDILSHERFKHISELKLPIGVDGDITLQWLKSTLPNLGLVVNDDHILPSNHGFVRMHKIEIIFSRWMQIQIIITIIICGVDFLKVELDYDVFFVPEKINERNTHLIFQIN